MEVRHEGNQQTIRETEAQVVTETQTGTLTMVERTRGIGSDHHRRDSESPMLEKRAEVTPFMMPGEARLIPLPGEARFVTMKGEARLIMMA